jgi:hypothetical protein
VRPRPRRLLGTSACAEFHQASEDATATANHTAASAATTTTALPVSPVLHATQLLSSPDVPAPVAAAAARFLAVAIRGPAALYDATASTPSALTPSASVFPLAETRTAVRVSVLFALVDALVALQRRICAASASAAVAASAGPPTTPEEGGRDGGGAERAVASALVHVVRAAPALAGRVVARLLAAVCEIVAGQVRPIQANPHPCEMNISPSMLRQSFQLPSGLNNKRKRAHTALPFIALFHLVGEHPYG